MRHRWLLALAFALVACGGREDERFSVLLLVPDTVRADHLSINGYHRPTTPRLDAFAREGTNFRQTITVAPRTWQSFSSILTGLYPTRHGVRFIFDHPIASETPTIATILKEQGYATRAFDGIPFLKGMTGGVGFDDYVIASLERNPRPDPFILEQTAEWIFDPRNSPFFALVRTTGGHWPYWNGDWIKELDDCSQYDHEFNRGSAGLQLAGPNVGARLTDPAANRKLFFPGDLEPDTVRHIIAHYDSEIRATDELLGDLIDRMRDTGLLERTIVVVTSDHGESFGEHGYMQHGPRVDEPVMRVPLMIRLPKSHPDYNPGREIEGLVRVIDLFPTLLDSLGIPPPAGLDGVSLLPAIRGEPLPALWAYGESGRSFMGVDPERHFRGVRGKHRMIRTADTKLIFIPHPRGGRETLFDIASDAGESREISIDDPERLAAMHEHLQAIFANEELIGEEPKMTSKEIEMLRSLGYIE